MLYHIPHEGVWSGSSGVLQTAFVRKKVLMWQCDSMILHSSAIWSLSTKLGEKESDASLADTHWLG